MKGPFVALFFLGIAMTILNQEQSAGITTTVKLEGEYVIKTQSFDAEPVLDEVQRMREAQEGKRWGEGRLVGSIPLPYYHRHIVGIQDKNERAQAVKRFFRENPQFVAYDRYLK